jgi:GxxExxY protein
VNRLSGRIIGSACQILNALGAGFLEKIYENALAHELRKSGFFVAQQQGVTVTYNGIVVGDDNVDIMVEGTIIIEPSPAAGSDPADRKIEITLPDDMRTRSCSTAHGRHSSP